MHSEKNKIRHFLNRESTAGVIFASPFIIGFFMFLFVPMVISLYYSFCDYNILSAPKFKGLSNYIKAFTKDPIFYKTIGVTLKFTFISVPLRLLFALLIALALLKNSKAAGIYRALFYLPSIFGGSVAVAVLWKRMFASDGVVNSILEIIGFPTAYSWLGNKNSALFVLIMLSIWQFGSSMLIFLASLKQIPTSLYEAAKVDGSNCFHRFFRITLPLLTPTIFFNLVMQMINGFLAFTQCMIITQGKPLNSTLFYAVYMYQQSFEFRYTGYGAALAWIMLFIIGSATMLLFATKKFWVYEEEG